LTHRYILQDATGYVGILEHSSPSLKAGDVVTLPDNRRAVVVKRIGAGRGSRFEGILEIATESSLPEP
jgi:hypothetical protein